MIDALLKLITQYIESNNEDPTIIAPPVSNRELINIDRNLKDIYDQPLVRFKNEEITVRAFIKKLQDMPPFHRPYLSVNERILFQDVANPGVFIRAGKFLMEAY
jgi:hypothetical protein